MLPNRCLLLTLPKRATALRYEGRAGRIRKRANNDVRPYKESKLYLPARLLCYIGCFCGGGYDWGGVFDFVMEFGSMVAFLGGGNRFVMMFVFGPGEGGTAAKRESQREENDSNCSEFHFSPFLKYIF